MHPTVSPIDQTLHRLYSDSSEVGNCVFEIGLHSAIDRQAYVKSYDENHEITNFNYEIDMWYC